MELSESLEELGFSPKEVKVYLAILKLGKSTPAEVAKLTKVGRPTVYNVARSLLTKGVIAEDKADLTLHLIALPPESLRSSIERTKVELTRKEKAVEEAIGKLLLLKSEITYPVPKLRFIEESELRDYLFESANKWHTSLLSKGGVWFGFQDHSFVEHYQDWIDWTVKKFRKSEYTVCLFSNASAVEMKLKGWIPIREVKFLKQSHFTATTWVVGDYVTMISTRNSPFYLIEIHDALMAANMREMFKHMWKSKK